MITVQVDDSRIMARLDAMPDRVFSKLRAKALGLRLDLEAMVTLKVGGEVLHVRSGALRRSIFGDEPQADRNAIIERVASSSDVKYAAIHEFGGTINVPEIVPVKAKALHFLAGGADVFATRARAHTVTMPERSFMRSSLADMRQAIIDGLREAAQQGVAP